MTNLFNPPQTFDLPLSKGGDLYVVFTYKTQISGVWTVTDYPAGATVNLVIDDDTPMTVAADIDGPNATVWETNSATVAAVTAGKLWRAVITYSNGLDRVICNGKTVRYDGSKKV